MKPTAPYPAAALTLAMLCALLLAGCAFPPSKSPRPTGASAIYTSAAHTVEARLTQVQSAPAANGVTPAAPSTATEQPMESETPQAIPSAGVEPGLTPAVSTGCDQAGFVSDVTLPDGSELAPGETFLKTWRLENTGSCTWTEAYALVFSEGDAMGAPSSVPLPQTVPPGEKVDLSVAFTAPEKVGAYRSDWQLRNASGSTFGIGEQAKTFWVKVNVIAARGVVLDFVSQASSAQWTSGVDASLTNPLSFGGEESASAGAAGTVDGRPLENGSTSGVLLLTTPYHDPGGAVRGVFPEYTIQPGDRLKARLGFLAPSGSCGAGDVVFEINYLEGDRMSELGEWEKRCDGSLLPVDLDLSEFQGKAVRFVLTVRANGEAFEDWAVWSSLRVEH